MTMLAARIQMSEATGAMNVNVPPIAKKPLFAKKPTPETTFRAATTSAVGAIAPGRAAVILTETAASTNMNREAETGCEEQVVGDVVEDVVQVGVTGARDLEYRAVEQRRPCEDHAHCQDGAAQHGGSGPNTCLISTTKVGPQSAHEQQEEAEGETGQKVAREMLPRLSMK
jgi:hypothetical protein